MPCSAPLARVLAASTAASLIFLLSGRAVGQQPRPADKVAIDIAIEKGVRFLKETQNPSGGWGKGTGAGPGKGWAVGHTCLACIALLESGVPTSDPAIRKAAVGVRGYSDIGELDDTYEAALAVLFLDRLHEKADRIRIQRLAARLMAGQSHNGGWGYTIPKLTVAEATWLVAGLKKMSPPQPPQIPSALERPSSLGLCIKSSDQAIPRAPQEFDVEKERVKVLPTLSPAMRNLPIFLHPNQVKIGEVETKDDNSNTHFAMLAVWAARKYDVPVERSLALVARRYRTSQAADGTWGYSYGKGGGTASMTCVALLGVAIGHVVDPEPGVRPEQDKQVVSGFAWLGKRVGAPAGSTENRPTVKSIGGMYYLWAMERIAVIYDVARLDNKDWYLWGAEILLCHQKGDGSWDEGGYHGENPILNTCLALLILKRANLTPDLSRRFTVDPSALNQLVSRTTTPQPPPTVTPQAQAPTPEPEPEPKVTTPAVEEPRVTPKSTPAPRSAAPQEAATQPTESKPAPAEKSSAWIWILLGVVVLALAGGGLFFLLGRSTAEKKPEKGKKKKKAKVGETAKLKATTRLKSKSRSDDDDDD